MKEVVKRILITAKERKVSNQAVCRLLNENRNKVDDWKKGKSSPTTDEVFVLSEYFDVSTDYLHGRTDDPTPHLTIPDEIKGALVAFNRGEFEDLTQGEIDALANIAKTFKTQREGSTNEMTKIAARPNPNNPSLGSKNIRVSPEQAELYHKLDEDEVE